MAQNKAGTGAPPRPVRPPTQRPNRKRRKPRTWRRLALWITGWFCIFLGVLGLFLPILQGILFLLIGLFVLSLVSPRIRLFRQKLRAKARARYPQWTGKFEEAEIRARRVISRILKPGKKRS